MTLLPIQIEHIVKAALIEDLVQGDITTDTVLVGNEQAVAHMICRESLVVSALAAAQLVFSIVDATLIVKLQAKNGDFIPVGTSLLSVEGSLASILKAERVALNFMQHLSGIATTTKHFVDALDGTNAQITDTRKTTPGLRLLEKQAVVDGGGSPHRYNLGSSVLVKDNHLSGVTIAQAVQRCRKHISHTQTIEVECDTLDQVQQAVDAHADIILLDNMSVDVLRQAVTLINGQCVTEASGNITLETVRAVAETGVQYISTSKLTLGAPAMDIGLDIGSI